MAGVRKDGILEVSDTGTGPSVPVKITEPIGPNVKANSIPVTLATNEDPIDVTEQLSPIANQTSVSDSASSVIILAANINRLGATITNTSTATLRVRLNSLAATLINYTVPIVSGAYYEVPFRYTGAITGIWDTNPNDGAALVSEFVA